MNQCQSKDCITICFTLFQFINAGLNFSSIVALTMALSLNVCFVKTVWNDQKGIIKKSNFKNVMQHHITYFWPMFPFYTPRHQGIIGFLVFSGDVKWEHWPEMGLYFALDQKDNLLSNWSLIIVFWPSFSYSNPLLHFPIKVSPQSQ